MASQNNLVVLPLLLLVISTSLVVIISCRPMTTNDLVSRSCKQTPDPETCEATLRADPRTSQVSDPESLMLIMIDSVKSHFIDSIHYAEGLGRTTHEADVKEAVRKCIRVYGVVVDANVGVATRAVKQGDPKFGEQAMLDSANEADACCSAFPKGKLPTEMPARTTELRRLSTVAASLINTIE